MQQNIILILNFIKVYKIQQKNKDLIKNIKIRKINSQIFQKIKNKQMKIKKMIFNNKKRKNKI